MHVLTLQNGIHYKEYWIEVPHKLNRTGLAVGTVIDSDILAWLKENKIWHIKVKCSPPKIFFFKTRDAVYFNMVWG